MTSVPGRLVLIGHPVSHSLSPRFQNAALRAAGIALTYEALDVAGSDLPDVMRGLSATSGAGNVTIPHKEAVAALCTERTELAARIGAVNTFAWRDGRLVGHNTDVAGVDHAARRLLGAAPVARIVGVLGAGGSAAAVLGAIEGWSGCEALVANRTTARAEALCARFRSIARVSDPGEIARRADIVVNATSLGLRAGDAVPIDVGHLDRATAVLDLVYGENDTPLVRAARARGLRATDGLEVLVAQGAAAFHWWFGRDPEVEVMWQALGRRPPA